jgi:carbon storage regulator
VLVLTRREGETVMIGEDISIRIKEIRGGKVSLGIEAPADVAVHRLEVWKRIAAERQGRRRRRGKGSEDLVRKGGRA